MLLCYAKRSRVGKAFENGYSARATDRFLRRKNATVGGLKTSLNMAVPYTSNAKPTICSHLKVSHPKPRETSQMNKVRQVSMVDRAVADIDRVTLRPKKLNPL